MAKMGPRPTHGQSSGGKTSEYAAWGSMKARCYRSNYKDFKNWGGRGIKVCPEWRESFSSFFAHIGPKPTPKHVLDRIDNDGNYEPGNVRWITKVESLRNRRPYNPTMNMARKEGRGIYQIGIYSVRRLGPRKWEATARTGALAYLEHFSTLGAAHLHLTGEPMRLAIV